MTSNPPGPVSRRMFLGGLAATGSAVAARPNLNHPAETDADRARQAYQIRVDAAQLEWDAPSNTHATNGDEDSYPNRVGNFSKGLPHNEFGEVDLDNYGTLLNALTTGRPSCCATHPLSVIPASIAAIRPSRCWG